MADRPKLIVLGGGFAGLRLVRELPEGQFDILLIDRHNHHQFQPLFYQVATSQLEPSSISFPFRSVFRNRKDVRIRMGKAISVNAAEKKLTTTIGVFDYDLLVVATGCVTNYYGNAELAKHTLPLKSTIDAIAVRNHLLRTLEKVLYSDPTERQRLLTFVIVGAGPTGVELAGALAEIRRDVLPRDYRFINFSQMHVLLVEGSANTLNSMSTEARKASADYLQNMGVTLLTETFVKAYDGQNLTLSSGENVATATVIWAAGVTGSPLAGLEMAVGPANRYKVDRFNRITGLDGVFALGDIALMETPLYPKGHPQLANVAIGQAKNLAKNLTQHPDKWNQYEYADKGAMATIGRNKAVVDLPFIRFKGYLAWVFWMALHLMLILGVRNKLIVFINWAWAYLTKNTSLGLILTDSDNNEK